MSSSKSTTAARSHVKLLSVLVGIFLFVSLCFDSVNSAPGISQVEKDSPNYGCNVVDEIDQRIFNHFDFICKECYRLYQNSDILNLCRSKCFSTPFFDGCLSPPFDEEKEILPMLRDKLSTEEENHHFLEQFKLPI